MLALLALAFIVAPAVVGFLAMVILKKQRLLLLVGLALWLAGVISALTSDCASGECYPEVGALAVTIGLAAWSLGVALAARRARS